MATEAGTDMILGMTLKITTTATTINITTTTIRMVPQQTKALLLIA